MERGVFNVECLVSGYLLNPRFDSTNWIGTINDLTNFHDLPCSLQLSEMCIELRFDFESECG